MTMKVPYTVGNIIQIKCAPVSRIRIFVMQADMYFCMFVGECKSLAWLPCGSCVFMKPTIWLVSV